MKAVTLGELMLRLEPFDYLMTTNKYPPTK